jgi:hypothetical protein
MGVLRNFFREHRRLVALLIVLALALKGLIPAGYMIDRNAKVLAVVICPDTNPIAKVTHAAHASQAHHHMGGKAGHSHGDHGKQDSSGACPYSLLPMASLAGAHALLLAVALTFILALGFAPTPPLRLARNPHLRPPLRGPPLLA